ncbi:ABC transporter ATP-binding protein [Polycladidibacter hongkongensis]|uniref:ABC transporter ATP-binding protein n=1 Tax=Polycladidibacter hongkongensis TaxID=1647556 RepID=UPI00082BE404|nr:ABC transporter ATP-binding protein [Pseudovibrio hongkongensis]
MLKFLKKRFLSDPDAALSLIVRLLKENFANYRVQYALAFLLMACAAGASAASAKIMKDIINEVFIAKDAQMVYIISASVLAIFTIKGLATYGQMVILSRVGNAIVAKLQKRMFDKVLRLGIDYFDRTSFGDLATRFGQNTSAARAVMDLVILTLGRDIMTIIGLVSVMIYQSPMLSFFAFFIMPPAVFAVAQLVRRVKRIAKSQFVSQTKILSQVKEMAQGIRIIKAFSYEKHMSDQMRTAISEVEGHANNIARLTARTSPLMESLGGVAIALIILYGGYSVINLDQDPGSFFSFITALLLAYDPIKRLARLQVNLNTQLVGVRLMYELLDTKEPSDEATNLPPLKVKGGDIRFDHVSFAYADKPALNGLSLHAKQGEMTALVGASGAGKSTLFSLLERFYEISSGTITIDGQDVAKHDTASLRKQIAIVTQDTYLFDRSIAQNIALSNPDADREAIINAAKQAHAHQFIEELPQGYDTLVGEGGGRLSGGQRQRIAIARAMLANAPILLLDEATSALDAASEAHVQAALANLMQGRTTLVIAHRLSTVRDAAQIIVMDKGRVVETGTHQQLYQADGTYRRLCELQFTSDT